MEAKDTVMDAETKYWVYHHKFKEITCRQENLMYLADYKTFCVEYEIAEALIETQAEISFKAGTKEVVEWIRNGTVMQVPRGTRVYRADKEKVLVQFDYTEWQAQLKDGGSKPHETHHD